MPGKNLKSKLTFGKKNITMGFIEELRWRGMIHDLMPGTEDQLRKENTVAYIGFDPTADSLHIGSLVQIMLLKHFQKSGHKPIALVGGATGMIGDPSGKSEERNLLNEEVLLHNVECIKKQLEKFLDFGTNNNSAEIVNNYDWFREMRVLDFLRDIGKHLSWSYMSAKDSVQKRAEAGISYTEFSYQLLQAYDFFWLFKNKNCKIQMGGSDQWGNIVSGTELIRRKAGQESFGVTCPLITKADGGKFGKTESGNIWLDRIKTSPYKFYQFWINSSDEDVKKYIRIFTLFSKSEVENLEKEHEAAPHLRILQKALAKEVTIRVHSEEDYNLAENASQILFGKGTSQSLRNLPEDVLLSVFEGVPQGEVIKTEIETGIPIVDFLVAKTKFLPSNNEARRALKENSISINQLRVDELRVINSADLLNQKFILLQRGKKNYFLARAL